MEQQHYREDRLVRPSVFLLLEALLERDLLENEVPPLFDFFFALNPLEFERD